MKHELNDTLSVFLTEKGKQILKMKDSFKIIENDTCQLPLWQLRMFFGKNTINLHNSNPVVDNKFFKNA